MGAAYSSLGILLNLNLPSTPNSCSEYYMELTRANDGFQKYNKKKKNQKTIFVLVCSKTTF